MFQKKELSKKHQFEMARTILYSVSILVVSTRVAVSPPTELLW